MQSRAQRAVYFSLGSALLSALLGVLPPALEVEEGLGLQALFRLRGTLPPPDNVAVVAIAGASADVYGLSSSNLDRWPRHLHASLIERLEEAGVAAVVMDIIFESPGVAAHDRALADAVAWSRKVLLLERVRTRPVSVEGATFPGIVLDYRIEPIDMFRRGAWGTAPFTLPTVPFRVSQFWAFGRGTSDTANLPLVALQAFGAPVYETFIRLLAASASGDLPAIPRTRTEMEELRGLEQLAHDVRRLFLDEPALAERMREALAHTSVEAPQRALLNALIDAYSGSDSRYLNYYGPTGTIRTIPYHVVERADSASLAELDLEGRVVFVGFSERRQAEQQDEFISVYSERTGLNLSGVEIGATAFANLAASSYIAPLSMRATLGLLAAWAFLLAFAMAWLSSARAIALAGVAGTLYFTAARYAFEASNLWLPLVVPLGGVLPAVLFAVLLLNYREVSRQRERVHAALGRYVPPAVAKRLASESFDARASRELVHGTCLISDAEQFTQLAESLDPKSLHTLIQQYFKMLGACVEQHGGFVADVSGDSMVAIWAAAKPDAELRASACRATLDVLREVERFNLGRGGQGLPTGVGLDSGELLLGNIGVAERYQYRAVGDIVNTASRIQGLNRQLGTRALVSEAALVSLTEFRARPVGDFLLYGKANAVAVHELLGIEGEGTDTSNEQVARFTEALSAFRQRDWRLARELLMRVLDEKPTDGPSRFYLRQCELTERATLPPDWRGTIRMAIK